LHGVGRSHRHGKDERLGSPAPELAPVAMPSSTTIRVRPSRGTRGRSPR
jgi:hypothetical protein